MKRVNEYFICSGSDPGAATRMKLIINMVMGSVVASLAEAMAMAEKVGLDLEDVAEVLSIGSLRCPTIIHKSQGKSLSSIDSLGGVMVEHTMVLKLKSCTQSIIVLYCTFLSCYFIVELH